MNKNTRNVLFVVAIILAVIIIVPSIVGGFTGWQGGDGWGWMGSGMMGSWMWFMPIFFIAFWGLVIWGIVAIVRGLSGSRGSDSGSNRSDSALEILDKRYARGEIDKAEYEERKKDLL